MTIEQAKEVLETHTQHFVPTEDIPALNIAIKSLDMWDKVIKEIKGQKYALDYCFPEWNNALDKSIAIIEKYKKEIEE